MALSGPFRLRDLVRDRTGFTVRPEVPTGVLYPYAGASAPSGYLLCQGQSVSTTTYAALFSVIGYTYGGSGGSFNLPDLRGRTPVGAGNDGSAANNATRNRGDKGGDTRMPQHNHGVTDPGHGHGMFNSYLQNVGGSAVGYAAGAFGLGFGANTQGAVTGVTVNNNGSGTGENMPPFVVTNYIIKV